MKKGDSPFGGDAAGVSSSLGFSSILVAGMLLRTLLERVPKFSAY